jgi:hypothetical protein
VVLLISGICFLFTFSRVSFVAMVLIVLFGLVVKSKKIKQIVNLTKILTFVLMVISPALLLVPFILKNYTNYPETVSGRISLFQSSGYLLSKFFVFGTGLNNYIIQLGKNIQFIRINWWLQPVHNIFLLILVETGITGYLSVGFVLTKLFSFNFSRRNYWYLLSLVFIMITGMADHYWLTINQTRLLLTLIITGLISKNG